MKLKYIIPSLVIALLTAATSANAQLIYENVADSNYDARAAWQVRPLPGPHIAERFVAGSDAFLDYIDVQVWKELTATSGKINAAIYSDGTDTPGTALEIVSSMVIPFFGNNISLTRIQFSDTTQLTAGTTYWIGLMGAEDGSLFAWESSHTGFSDIFVSDKDGGLDDPFDGRSAILPQGGLRVMGTQIQGGGNSAVPEPSTYGIFGAIALLALIAKRRFKK